MASNTAPLFPLHVLEKRASGGTYDTDCETYLREMSQVNADMWSEMGGYAAYAERLEDDDPDEECLLPTRPSDEEYTRHLQEDLYLGCIAFLLRDAAQTSMPWTCDCLSRSRVMCYSSAVLFCFF